jgi:cysteine synthase
VPAGITEALGGVDRMAADPRNLYRVHWYNPLAGDRPGQLPLPEHVVLPSSLTGIESPVIVVLGEAFPMITAHKVLAAYACLAPRVITGQFDPTVHRAVWPSTGNYARGGVAISRIMGCRGVAVLPEGMSQERFDWLDRWVADPADVVRTPGSESNVKEIYDACKVLAADPTNVVLNQFCEFGNHLAHLEVTAAALAAVFDHVAASRPDLRLAAFVSATGSAGTIGAGDRLKERYGARIVAAEALECPTLLENGFGEHNIQGIGDKHVPLIHNVMNTDVVIGVSDQASDALNHLFHNDVGRRYLIDRRRIDPVIVNQIGDIGISGLANIVASIKLARHLELGPGDVVMTVATDGASMYETERRAYEGRHYPHGFDEVNAGEAFGRHLDAIADDHVLELGHVERTRIFNLGYYTWVEQQGVSVDDFDRRRDQRFWHGLVETIPAWDRLIDEFNDEVGHAPRRRVS